MAILGDFIQKYHIKKSDWKGTNSLEVLGVSNVEGITKTSHIKSEDLSDYLIIEPNTFAYNPYRINVGSIGFNKEKYGLVSPAYIVFKVKSNKIIPELLLEFLKSFDGLQQINKYAKGTVRKALRYDDLCKIEVNFPSFEKQLSIFENKIKIDYKSIELGKEIEQQQQLLAQFKQAILQEAIQGKLTENWRETLRQAQGDKTESASELLKRIKAEKAKLIKENKIKKEKDLAPISKEEIPFEIPENWVWCKLGEVNDLFLGGAAFSSSTFLKKSNIQVIRISNVKNNIVDLEKNAVYIDELNASENLRNELHIGDILITMTGTRAKRDYCFSVVLKDEHFKDYNRLFLNQRVGCFRINKSIKVEYLSLALKSNELLEPVFESSTGSANQANISKDALLNILIPLPPLSEQQAIVEKVESLISKCTALEQEISKNEQYANMLMQAVLKEAFESKETVVESVQMDRSIQLALMQMMFKQNLGINYGEVIMQKTAYNLDHLYHKEPSFFPYSYQSSNHGAFSVQLRRELESNPYLATKSTEKGKVLCLESKQKATVLDSFSNPVYKDYIQSLTQLLEIYSLPIIGKKSDQIELFNTVLKIMNDLSVKDIETIYTVMENWEIEQKGYRTKAEKFSKPITEKMLELILNVRKRINKKPTNFPQK